MPNHKFCVCCHTKLTLDENEVLKAICQKCCAKYIVQDLGISCSDTSCMFFNACESADIQMKMRP